VDAGQWTAPCDASVSLTDALGKDWLRGDLSDTEATKLFKGKIVVITHLGPLSAAILEPFLSLYFMSKSLECDLHGVEPGPDTAGFLLLCGFPLDNFSVGGGVPGEDSGQGEEEEVLAILTMASEDEAPPPPAVTTQENEASTGLGENPPPPADA